MTESANRQDRGLPEFHSAAERLPVALFLLAAHQLGAIGWMPPWVNNLWLLACLLALWGGQQRSMRLAPLYALLGVSFLGLGWWIEVHSSGLPTGVLALMVALLCCELGGATGARQRSVGLACSLAAVVLTERLLSTPLGFHLEERASRGLSIVAGLLLPGKLNLGPEYAGLRLWLLAVLLPMAWWGSSRLLFGQYWRRWLYGGLISPLLMGGTLLLVPTFGTSDSGHSWRILAAVLPSLILPLWLGLLCTKSLELPYLGGSRRLWPLALAWMLAAFFATHVDSRPALGKVGIYERGLVSWGIPENGTYGEYSAGMMGTLPRFLSALGASTRMLPDLTSEELVEMDSLVVVNLDHALPKDEIEAIRDWIEEGGHLYLLGDHTAMVLLEDRAVLAANDLLEGSAIRFRNDSADPLTPAWEAATVRPGLGRRLQCLPDNPSGSLVGASLDTGIAALPLAVGRFGYADEGTSFDQGDRLGFLGDLNWNTGERLGSLVLAAWSPLGHGTVSVVADTTGGTNLGRMLYGDWWSRFFTQAWVPQTTDWLFELLFAGIALLVTSFGLIRRWSPLSVACCALAAVWIASERTAEPLAEMQPVASAGVQAAEVPARVAEPSATSVALAVIDCSAAPSGRTGSWESDGLISLAVGLERSGYLAQVVKFPSAELLERANVIMLPTPQVAPKPEHLERWIGCVEAGATLIAGGGFRQVSALGPLLDRLDAWIAPRVHVGQVAEWVNQPQAVDSPFMPESWWLGGSPQWRPRLLVEDHMVVGERRLGAGRVVFIADPDFMSNYAQEGKWGHNLGNLSTLQTLVASASGVE